MRSCYLESRGRFDNFRDYDFMPMVQNFSIHTSLEFPLPTSRHTTVMLLTVPEVPVCASICCPVPLAISRLGRLLTSSCESSASEWEDLHSPEAKRRKNSCDIKEIKMGDSFCSKVLSQILLQEKM